MATYEGKWRCARCSNANLDRNLNCLSCGVKRGKDAEFFLDDESIVADEYLLKQANAGADWICDYCTCNNRAAENNCSSCGNARRRRLERSGKPRGARFYAAKTDANDLAAKIFFRNRPLKFGLLGTGLLAPVIIAVPAAFVYVSALTYPIEIEVANLKWQRSIAVEEFRRVTETAWEGELPAEANIQSQSRDLYRTDKVASGTREVAENYNEQVADGTVALRLRTGKQKERLF